MNVNKKKIMMVNWDNYPNIPTGGVYVWERDMIKAMKDYDFIIANFVSNPNVQNIYSIPRHVVKVINMPMWGCYRYQEFLKNKGQNLFLMILRTTNKIIENKFLPLYKKLLYNLFSEKCDYDVVIDIIYNMYNLFLKYDPKKCVQHPSTWEILMDILNADDLYKEISVYNAQRIHQIIKVIIQIISLDLPKVDLVHCSLAWLPSLIAITQKKKWNCPVIVTEHGVALREIVLTSTTSLFDEASSNFWKIFCSNIIKTIYSIADVIAPVCYANAVWEQKIGAEPSKIRVIYNGVDTQKFRPVELSEQVEETHIENKRRITIIYSRPPTIIYLGRISIFKDLVNLLQAIVYVKKKIPNIRCLIYGGTDDLDYSLKLVNLIKSLELEDNVTFMGKTFEPQKKYTLGNIVILPSIAEGFPFSVIEAMACGKAVISTDVGGVREVLENCGLLIRTRHPIELGNAIISLIRDTNLRKSFEELALKTIKKSFKFDLCIEHYDKLYKELIENKSQSRQQSINNKCVYPKIN